MHSPDLSKGGEAPPASTRRVISPRERRVNNVLMLLVLAGHAYFGSVHIRMALSRLHHLDITTSSAWHWLHLGVVAGAGVIWSWFGGQRPVRTALAAMLLMSVPVGVFNEWQTDQEAHIAISREMKYEHHLALKDALPFPFEVRGNVVDGYEVVVGNAGDRAQRTADALTKMGLVKK